MSARARGLGRIFPRETGKTTLGFKGPRVATRRKFGPGRPYLFRDWDTRRKRLDGLAKVFRRQGFAVRVVAVGGKRDPHFVLYRRAAAFTKAGMRRRRRR